MARGTFNRGLSFYWLDPAELVPCSPKLMTRETPSPIRKYERISLPKGMTVAWYGGGDSQVSRVKTLGSGACTFQPTMYGRSAPN